MNITIADIDTAADARAASEMFAVLAEHMEGAPPRAARTRRTRGAGAATETATAPTPTEAATVPAVTPPVVTAPAAPVVTAPAAPVVTAPVVTAPAAPAAAAPTDPVELYKRLTEATPATPPVPAEAPVAPDADRVALEARARAVAQDRGAAWFMPYMEQHIDASRRQITKMTSDELSAMISAAALG